MGGGNPAAAALQSMAKTADMRHRGIAVVHRHSSVRPSRWLPAFDGVIRFASRTASVTSRRLFSCSPATLRISSTILEGS